MKLIKISCVPQWKDSWKELFTKYIYLRLIRDDRRITIDDIAERVGVSHGSAVNIVNELGFAKVCARWVPRQLLDFHKQARFEACSELIECHRSDKNFSQPYSDRR